MEETQSPSLTCTSAIQVKVSDEQARDIVSSWLGISQGVLNDLNKSKIRFGRTVLVYCPFWKYLYEDGGEDTITYRPACGTLMTGFQDMQRQNTVGYPITDDMRILPATVSSSVYKPELHGIHRGEELIAIPMWLISYKVKKSIYMVEVDAETGKIYEEWHPVGETVNWRKTALIIFIPMLILSFLAAYLTAWLFILVGLLLVFFLYQSDMISMLNLKRKEGKDGS